MEIYHKHCSKLYFIYRNSLRLARLKEEIKQGSFSWGANMMFMLGIYSSYWDLLCLICTCYLTMGWGLLAAASWVWMWPCSLPKGFILLGSDPSVCQNLPTAFYRESEIWHFLGYGFSSYLHVKCVTTRNMSFYKFNILKIFSFFYFLFPVCYIIKYLVKKIHIHSC